MLCLKAFLPWFLDSLFILQSSLNLLTVYLYLYMVYNFIQLRFCLSSKSMCHPKYWTLSSKLPFFFVLSLKSPSIIILVVPPKSSFNTKSNSKIRQPFWKLIQFSRRFIKGPPWMPFFFAKMITNEKVYIKKRSICTWFYGLEKKNLWINPYTTNFGGFWIRKQYLEIILMDKRYVW